MLREIHRYTWLTNSFMGRGLKKGQNDRMTHINIDLSSLNFNHSVSLKGIPSEKVEKYANM